MFRGLFLPVLRTVLGRVFDLSSFPPPDQYLFLPTPCYHSSMNIASQPEDLTLSSAEGSRPPQLPSAKAGRSRLFSRLSSVDPRLLSNRQIPELESPVSPRKQRTGPLSNRHKFAFCNLRPLLIPASLPPCLPASSPASRHSRLSTPD